MEIDSLREGEITPEKINNYIEKLREDNSKIDIPERSSLYTETKYIDSLERLININGVVCHPIFAFISNMINSGKTPIIVIVGKEGNGKSMAGLVLANTLHNINVCRGEFDPEKQVVYDPIEFGILMRNSTRKVMFFEEANETLNSNQYNSKMNNLVAGSKRTQRKRENVYLFVCPELNELDPRIVDNVDVVFNMKYEREAEITIYENKYAKRGSRGLEYFFDNNIPNWGVPDVDPELQSIYEEIDNSFKGQYLDELLLKALMERLEELEDRNKNVL